MFRRLVLAAALVSVGTAYAAPVNVERLLQSERVLTEKCQGGSGDKPETAVACARRNAVVVKLEKLGWEFGYEGWISACATWHPASEAKPNRPECEAE